MTSHLIEPVVGVVFVALWFVAEVARFPNVFVMVPLGLAIALSRLAPRMSLISVLVGLAVSTFAAATFPQRIDGQAQPSTWLHPMTATDWPIYLAVLVVPALVAIWADRRTLRISLIAAGIAAVWLAALVAASSELPWNHGRIITWIGVPTSVEARAFLAFSLVLLLLALLVWLIGWGIGGVLRFMRMLLRDPVIRVRIQDALHLGPHGASRPLTTRERDVLLLVADGRSNAEIATALFLSEATVKSHLRSILTKLGLKSRTEIVAHAWRTGMVQVG